MRSCVVRPATLIWPGWCAGRFCELYDGLWNRLNVAGGMGAALQSPGGAFVAGVPSAALVSLQRDVADLSADLQARASGGHIK